MKIVRTLGDIKKMKAEGAISAQLANHWRKKIGQLRTLLAPEVSLETFDMDACGTGVFGLVEAADTDLRGIGITDLSAAWPEFVTRLVLGAETFFIVYLMRSNDEIDQIYAPAEGALKHWLEDQAVEDEPEVNGFDGELPEEEPF